MNIRDFTSVNSRRKALEKELGIALAHIGHYSLDVEKASSRNCENMIGVIQVPIGVAGPLLIHADTKRSHVYVPLATTEGALVASVNRGCKAITESGGATVNVRRVGASRGAVFHVQTIGESETLRAYVMSHKEYLSSLAQKTSSHITLTDVLIRSVGRYVFIRFVYNTQNAMGMNMATIATTALCTALEQETGAKCVSVAGNFDVDKKPSWLNVIEGRGISVEAEVELSKEVIHTLLKTSAQAVYDVWLAKCMVGSAISGSMGFNAHIANIVAAIFLATGQDIAHVTEASAGITLCDIKNDALHVSVSLSDCMVGVIGGGTGLATQSESLSLLGLPADSDEGAVLRLAAIVGAATLAGEVSLLSSLSEGSLARSHESLARGKR